MQTLHDGKPRGVVWLRDDDGNVNSYCDTCSTRLEEAGGEWNHELEAEADPALVCEGCFRRLLSINNMPELH